MFFDPDTRELLRTRPNPLTAGRDRPAARRPPGRAATAATDRTGPGAAAGLGHRHRHGRRAEDRPRPVSTPARPSPSTSPTPTSSSTATASPRTLRRTTDHPVRSIKAHRPRKVDLNV